MRNLRTYGTPPYAVAVIHGGPGAGGEMAPVARRLCPGRGILEPIQTATTLDGQVEELRMVLQNHSDPPVTLIGYSWGAWLSLIVAARYPVLVRKLILVGSGAFEHAYVAQLQATRFSRLSDTERDEFELVVEALGDPTTQGKDALLARLGALASKTDEFDPVREEPDPSGAVELQGDIFQGVWNDAAEMRRSGELLALAAQVRCPVMAFHGDYDPTPAEGVAKPLSAVLGDFRFILLEKCGHTPWIERHARDTFYAALEREL